MKGRFHSGLMGLAFLALACTGLSAQVTYQGGRAGGSITFSAGNLVMFSPGYNPAPDAFWIGVVAGGGDTLIRDGANHQTSNLTLNQGDVLVFRSTPPFYLNFRGTTMQIFYGGTILDTPPGPVCNTGALGPVMIAADKVLNFMAESQVSGNPKLAVTSYLSTVAEQNGSLSYYRIGAYQNPVYYTFPACSGGDCCSPTTTVFVLKNLSGGIFTIYELDSSGPSDFDWNTSAPSPLSCSASGAPTSGMSPLKVTFTASVSGGSPGYTWNWNFGDGATSTKKNPTHTYEKGGNFTWKMTVSDAANNSCMRSGTVKVTGPLAVTASVNPRQSMPPFTAAFNSVVTGGTPPYTYAWDFSDGGTANIPNPSHAFVTAGTFECQVTVTDKDDKSAAATVPVYSGVPIPPSVTSMSALTSPFRLKVVGSDFMNGCTATINDAPVPQVLFKDPADLMFKGGSSLKALVPKGVSVCVKVINPDGTPSACFTYVR